MVPGEGNDYNVCTTWGILGERFYLLDIFREQLNYPDLRRNVIRLRRELRATMVLVEWAGSGVSLFQDLDGYGGDRINYCEPKDNKVTRVAHQSAKFEAGHVYLPRKASWLSAFETEIAAFPNGRHDDQVDSMTMFLRNHRPEAETNSTPVLLCWKMNLKIGLVDYELVRSRNPSVRPSTIDDRRAETPERQQPHAHRAPQRASPA